MNIVIFDVKGKNIVLFNKKNEPYDDDRNQKKISVCRKQNYTRLNSSWTFLYIELESIIVELSKSNSLVSSKTTVSLSFQIIILKKIIELNYKLQG